MTKSEWGRLLGHVPIGIAFGIMMLFSQTVVIGVVSSITFLAYQIIQDWRKGDKSYKDVKGFLVGLGLVGGFIVIVGFLGR